jgi:hypothetical protein
MRALSLDAITQKVKELDIVVQANTVYSFFNSISIDELSAIKEHTIYCDSNAMHLKKTPYFIGEQLIFGNALILGQNELTEVDATIPKADLEKLINFNLPPFYKDVLELFATSDEVNIYKVFELTKDDKKYQLNGEWLLYTFNIADGKTKDYFLSELKKVVEKSGNIEDFIHKMSALALNAID